MQAKIDKDKMIELLKKFTKEAEDMLKNPEEIQELIKKLPDTLKEAKILDEVKENISSMVSMVKSYIKKEYTVVPTVSIIAIVATIIYLVNPLDIIPDTIFGIGLADDMVVVALCWKFIKTDIEEYEKWVKNQPKDAIVNGE